MTDPREAADNDLSDEQLMSQVSRGHRGAFGLLVERHHQAALNLAYRLSGNPELSRDVVQESYLRILKAARRYEPRGQFRSYLFGVVRNVVRELSRRQRSRREERLDPGSGGDSIPGRFAATAAEPSTPVTVVEGQELRDRLFGILQSMPEPLRVVFVLSEMEGLSYSEIARICGCPMGTVASRKHAAVSRLRAGLGPFRSS